MKRSLLTLTIISAFLALYLIGCGGGDGVSTITPNMQSSEGTLEITVPWPEASADLSSSLIQTTVNKITAELKSSADPNATVIQSITIDKTVKSGTMSGVSTGTYYLDLKGLDSTDSIITRRIKKVTIVSGTNTVPAILGVQITNGKISPRNLPISPNDILYFANTDNTAYIIRFTVNGAAARLDLPALSGLSSTETESVKYTFPDSIVSASTMSIYTTETGAAVDTIDYTVELSGGQNYKWVGKWGIEAAYDANYGCVFVAADQDANFFVGVYDPYSVADAITDNVNYAQYYANHIEKYDSSGKHLTSEDIGFKIDTSGVIQMSGLAVDPQGNYLYVTDCAGDNWLNGGTTSTNVQNTTVNPITWAALANTPVSAAENAARPLTGTGGRVLRFNARSAGTWVNLGVPTGLGYTAAAPFNRTGGFCFGENNNLCTDSTGRYLYVPEFYSHVITGAPHAASRGEYMVHRCDLANLNNPVWDGGTTFGGAFPIDLIADTTSIGASTDIRIIYPTGTASSTSGEIYVTGLALPEVNGYDEPQWPDPTHPGIVTRIVTYRGDGVRVTRNYPPYSLGTYPSMTCITGIAAYNVPSGAGSVGEAVFAMDWTNYSAELNRLYKYDGKKWDETPFKSPFTIPVPTEGMAGQDTGALTAPYPRTIRNYPGGGVPQIMSVAVCPNQTQEVYASDAFHRVWKLDNVGNETDRWRLLYRCFANPAGTDTDGVATDASNNVYVVDNMNCRVLKYKSTGDYITQIGTPPYLAVADKTDLMNYYDANADKRLLTAGTYPTQRQALVNTNSLAAAEFYYPWGIAVDGQRNTVYVVDWAENTVLGNTGRSVGRVQKFQAPSDLSAGKMSSRLTGTGVQWCQSVQYFFWYPTGISYGKDFVWVCDTFTNTAIRPNVPAYGTGIVQKFNLDGGDGLVAFTGAEGQAIWHPWGLATDTTNNVVYLSDTRNSRVLMYDLDTSAYKKQVSTAGGTGATGKGQFYYPVGCNLDKNNDLYVVDNGNKRMQKNLASAGGWIDAWDSTFLLDGFYTSIDNSGQVYTTDGEAHTVRLYQPQN